jgi:hypothetical protein
MRRRSVTSLKTTMTTPSKEQPLSSTYNGSPIEEVVDASPRSMSNSRVTANDGARSPRTVHTSHFGLPPPSPLPALQFRHRAPVAPLTGSLPVRPHPIRRDSAASRTGIRLTRWLDSSPGRALRYDRDLTATAERPRRKTGSLTSPRLVTDVGASLLMPESLGGHSMPTRNRGQHANAWNGPRRSLGPFLTIRAFCDVVTRAG